VNVGRDLLELGDRLIELGLRAAGQDEELGRVLDDGLRGLDGEAALGGQRRAMAADLPVMPR